MNGNFYCYKKNHNYNSKTLLRYPGQPKSDFKGIMIISHHCAFIDDFTVYALLRYSMSETYLQTSALQVRFRWVELPCDCIYRLGKENLDFDQKYAFITKFSIFTQ